MTKLAKALILTVALMVSGQAQAFFTPVGFSIVPPLQFPPDNFTITGARVSLLWGLHRDVYGFDVGLLGNVTSLTFVGMAVAGGFNMTRGTTTILGLQLAGGANINTSVARIVGLQLALGMNQNVGTSWVAGLQLAGINNAEHTSIYGVQAALYNKAEKVYGFQIGLINVTNELHGIQIGLLNFNPKGPFVVSPLINVGF